MKKLLFVVGVFFLMQSWSFAQQDQDKKGQFGLSIFPNFSNTIGRVPPGIDPANLPVNQAEMISVKSFSLTFFRELPINNHFSWSIGMGYQNTGSQTKQMFQLNGVAGIGGPLLFRIRFIQRNLELPIHVKYSFGKRWYALLGASGVANFYTYGAGFDSLPEFIELGNPLNLSENHWRKINAQLNLGLGFEQRVGQWGVAFIQPYFQYGLLGVEKSNEVRHHTYNVGAAFGLRM